MKRDNRQYQRMNAGQRRKFQQAVAEEQAAKPAYIEAAKKSVPRLLDNCDQAMAIVTQFRETREALGSLAGRTGTTDWHPQIGTLAIGKQQGSESDAGDHLLTVTAWTDHVQPDFSTVQCHDAGRFQTIRLPRVPATSA